MAFMGSFSLSVQGETGKRFNRYRASLMPRLSYLALRTSGFCNR